MLELDGNRMTGFTTRQDIMDSLRSALTGTTISNEVRLLPDEVMGGKTVGIINVSVANLRSKPGHSQELATQALMGTPVQLLDLVDGWYLVRTPDRYLAWLEPGALVAMTPQEAGDWMAKAKWMFFGADSGVMMSVPSLRTADFSSDLVYGNLVRFDDDDTDPKYSRIFLPDGTAGYVYPSAIIPRSDLMDTAVFSPAVLLSRAKELAGRPYLWGGTSSKGMDCSGFTKMAYYLNGFVIPRDASQQVLAGEEVELTDDFANLLPGDQLFFGRYRDDGSERITHTGFYLGGGRFLHAGADNGRIRENSLLPGDADFAEHRLKSLLRARRLTPGTKGVVTVGEAFGQLIDGVR